jgi:hypothetical protein
LNAGTIFGRQPVVWVGAIQSVLVLLVSFGWLDPIGLHGEGDVGLVAAVLNGAAALYLAFVTSESWLAPAVELAKASLALGVIYGLNVSTEKEGLAIAALTTVFALVHQGKTSPLASPTFSEVPAGSWRVNAG